MLLSRTDRLLPRLLILVAALTIAVAACGDDTTPIEAGDPGQDEPGTTGDQPDGDQPDEQDGDEQDDAMAEVSDGYQPVEAMPDIVDPQVADIDDVVVDADDLTLIVRYTAASEPCSGAIVEVVEADASIAVTLKTGLNPNAAAMTCVAGVFGYEQAVILDDPVAGRDIIIVGSVAGGATDGGADDEPAADGSGALTSPDGFIGLPLDEAQRLADSEGRPWRIGRQDGESFALTEDYNEERVTFEVDDGVVTATVAG